MKYCAIAVMALVSLSGCSKDINVVCEGREKDLGTNQLGPQIKIAFNVKMKGKKEGSAIETCDAVLGTDTMTSCMMPGDTVFASQNAGPNMKAIVYNTTTKTLDVTKAVLGPNVDAKEFSGICR